MSETKGRRSMPPRGVAHIEKIADALEIPREFLAGTLKITVVGNTELTAEGKLSVIEYTDGFLSIASSGFILTLTGEDFEVTQLETDYLQLHGKICSFSYIS